jgi:hypothetical protein
MHYFVYDVRLHEGKSVKEKDTAVSQCCAAVFLYRAKRLLIAQSAHTFTNEHMVDFAARRFDM